MKEIVLDLMCELNQQEVNDRAQQLSSTITRADEVEAEKKSSAKHYTEQLEALGGAIRRLSSVIRQRAESRPVTCAVLFHRPTTGTKRIVRGDTGEIVRDEAMTAYELQNNLFDEPQTAEELAAEIAAAEAAEPAGPRPVEEIAQDVIDLGLTEAVLDAVAAPVNLPVNGFDEAPARPRKKRSAQS
jgi:hypothetical protein